MRFFYLQKPILDVDYLKLCDAFVYTVFFRYLEKPAEKKDKKHHVEIYSSIDMYFHNKGKQTIIQFKNWKAESGIGYQPFIAIHQEDKQPVDIAKLYKGMEKKTLEFLEKKVTSKDYNSCFYTYPITTGAYFKGNKMFSSYNYKEFMDQGGNHLEVLFQSVKEKEFPNNLHEYYRKKLTEDWQKQVYDELLEAYNTKAFDIDASNLRYHITRKQYKYFKCTVLDNLHIEVLNEHKRNLFLE